MICEPSDRDKEAVEIARPHMLFASLRCILAKFIWAFLFSLYVLPICLGVGNLRQSLAGPFKRHRDGSQK